MNNIPEILEEIYTVTSADTDFTKKLNPASLVNMFIQSAWHHAEALGFGIDFLHKNETMWMLSRLHVKTYLFPFWNEKIVMRTWPKGIHRVFYQRDFEAFTINKELVAQGTSEWLIIDLKAKRPRLFHTDHHIFNPEFVKHANETHIPVLETPALTGEDFQRKVRYSDIDLNEHLTTTRYIDWMFDTFDLSFLIASQCKEVVLNFIHEIPFASKVNIMRYFPGGKQNGFLFEFIHPEKNQVFFRGRLTF